MTVGGAMIYSMSSHVPPIVRRVTLLVAVSPDLVSMNGRTPIRAAVLNLPRLPNGSPDIEFQYIRVLMEWRIPAT